jgi:hypothetical protein
VRATFHAESKKGLRKTRLSPVRDTFSTCGKVLCAHSGEELSSPVDR